MTWRIRSSVETDAPTETNAPTEADVSTKVGAPATTADAPTANTGASTTTDAPTLAYRRLMSSAVCSRLAGSAELVVLNWWVLHVTGNPAMIGVVTAARLIPLLFSAPVAGALADRYSPFALVTAMCGVSAVFTAALGLAVHYTWPLAAVCALLAARGLAIAAEPTMRQLAVAHLAEVVPRSSSPAGSFSSDAPGSPTTARTVKGMADLSTITTLCLVAGPLLSGLLLASIGPGGGMAVLAVLIATAALCTGSVVPWNVSRVLGFFSPASWHRPGKLLRSAGTRTSEEWSRGRGSTSTSERHDRSAHHPSAVAVMRNDQRLCAQIVVALGPMLAVFPYTSMIPVVVGSVASGMKETTAVAIASAAAALGGVVTTLCLRRRAKAIARPGKVAFIAAGLSSVALVMCALMVAGMGKIGVTGGSAVDERTQPWALVGLSVSLVVLGSVGQLYRTMNRAAVVTLAPEESRGAVLGVSNMDRVLIPLGSMVCGVVAARWGVPWMLMVMALSNVILLLPAAALLIRGQRRY